VVLGKATGGFLSRHPTPAADGFTFRVTDDRSFNVATVC
jgi:hypothetical protein